MPRVSGKLASGGDLAKLGAVIRQERGRLGLSQEALADLSGLDRSHMGKIERGERNPSLLNLLRIARGLEVPLADLVRAANL